MFDDYNICPYTGLRSFTEEESIYFKGRDEHIQEATKQLEKNKFLMVTGASGDGKSSIVYAGIIPNARAGFLKSKYSNWQIADFRPERSPFENLCKSIAGALGINNVGTVESELQHGFAALVDLYKSSKLSSEKSSLASEQISNEEKSAIRQSSANLIILVDQFEEFFTNPENYVNGAPSGSATLTMNLLLETAKIAYDEGLPIYVVFTMRSDYIGQCAAFRELPEFIGFSQFFVPRLNRKLLQEVIEEPCTLSGNRITRRLTERIILDMTEGVDQLPILQHALNQIWKAADDGKEEMDLIHYAKVGGLDPSELTDEDRVIFNEWFQALPENIKQCFQERSLHSVLNTHANKIYESAADYYKEKSSKAVPAEVAHAIIKTTFTSLTKIDQSREVRNRMTLGEISDILNRPDVDLETIAGVLNVFREPGNTFIRPFILDDPESHTLTENTVLDITHESLIRNWAMLKSWAKEEYDKFVVFKDFKQQVDRWLEYNKSAGFLLPIGSLTFFEKWYVDSAINKYWVNRYNEQVTDTPKNIDESSSIYDSCNEFLERSAKKHVVTKAIIKFGPRRIGAVFALVLVLGLLSYLYFDFRKRTSDYVLQKVDEDAIVLLNGDKAPYNVKATYLINSERLEKGRFEALLNSLNSDQNKLNIAIAAAELLNVNDRHGGIDLKKEALIYAGNFASTLYPSVPSDPIKRNEALRELLDLAELYEYYDYLYGDPEVGSALNKTSQFVSRLILDMAEQPHAEMDMQKFLEGVELGLNHNQFTKDEMAQLVTIFTDPSSAIQANFSKNKIIGVGRGSETLTYGGKFQALADLYASMGNVEACLGAIDKILEDQPRYPDFVTDGNSVAGYFIHYDYWDALDDYVAGYGARLGYEPYEIYRQIASRSGIVTQSVYERNQYNTFGWINLTYNTILDYMSDEQLNKLYKYYYKAVLETTAPGDERRYYLAIYYKQKGLYAAKRFEDKKIPRMEWLNGVRADFDKAFDWFNQVGAEYKGEVITGHFHLPTEMVRKQLFTYPDYVEEVPSHAPRTRYANYLTPEFMLYMIDNNLLASTYQSGSDLQQVITWINDYNNAKYVYAWNYQLNEIDFDDLQKIDTAFVEHEHSELINKNLLLFILADRSFRGQNSALAISYVERVNKIAIPNLFNQEWIAPHVKIFNLIGEIFGNLAIHNETELMNDIYNTFSDIRNQATLLDQAATNLYLDGADSLAKLYYDSADQVVTNRTEIGGRNRLAHAYATAARGAEGDFRLSKEITRNLGGFLQNRAYSINLRATAYRGYYYEAYASIPNFSSSEERLNVANQILYSQLYYNKDSLWSEYDYRMEYINMVLWYF